MSTANTTPADPSPAIEGVEDMGSRAVPCLEHSAGQGLAEGEWLRQGTFVYTLKQEGWRRGAPVMVNRTTIQVSGDDAEAVAELVRATLSSAAKPATSEESGTGRRENQNQTPGATA